MTELCFKWLRKVAPVHGLCKKLYINSYDFAELILRRRIQLMPYGNTFRSDAHYNNIVYSLSGRIAEAVAGQRQRRRISWEDLLETHILRPLGMSKTSFYHRRTEAEMFATPYGHVGDADGLRPRPTELNIDIERQYRPII